jgi:hypothetical protein
MSKSACGQHTELVSNNAIRVTKCSCGTLHVTVVASGVTVRMNPEVFKGFAAGMRAAEVRFTESEPVEISSTGSTSIN